jgi:23S rRNA (cytidine1920-2'-O)/16S rRNA (cytidine1409-2'-O)-methyltransferase
MVLVDAEVEVTERARYVSRGGVKLENALGLLSLDVSGRRCLDAGASTGGFTDCLLQGGAAEVIAVDVGYGELAWSLREDPRVHVLERTNARLHAARRAGVEVPRHAAAASAALAGFVFLFFFSRPVS